MIDLIHIDSLLPTEMAQNAVRKTSLDFIQAIVLVVI